MKKKKSTLDRIYTGVTIVVLLALSKGCISDYTKGGDNKAISNYEKMLFDSTIATARLDPEYKEVTVTIMHVPIKSYEFRYKFYVGTESYEGGITYTKLPTKITLPVYYLKDDPNFNSSNPEGALATEKAKNTSRAPLYWGIAWGLLGILLLPGFISELREPRPVQERLAAG
jgi:hypothetical protein